jgi:putative membrane protein insertion efficiency factor
MMRRLLMGLVRGYQLLISPALGPSCRFEPSCSAYAMQALAQHGAAAGSYLALRRIGRCQPWCDGGHDPVPADPPKLFSRLDSRRDSPTFTKKKSS